MSSPTLRAVLFSTVATVAAAIAFPALAETLTVASSTSYQTFDAHNALVPGAELGVVSQFYSSLLTRDRELKLRGELAESWEAVDDTTWKFVLKPGIVFPNGEPLDAAAVKWNIETVINPDNGARARSWFALIDSAEAVSPTELLIKTKEPFGALPEQMTLMFMMAPKWASETDPTLNVMGTGPYKLDSYTPNDQLVMVANPDYFGEAPAFDRVVVRIIPDASARVAGFLAGELDVVTDILPTDVAQINASDKGTAGATSSNRSMVLKFNHSKAPLDNLALRQAINYAIDKEAIVDGIYDGLGRVSQCQVLTPAHFGFNPDLAAVPYDPVKAKELVAQSGLATPIDIELEVPTGRYLLSQDTAQVVVAQLAEIGINAQIKEMEFTSWMSKYANAKDMGQMSILSQGYPTVDAGGTLNLFRVTTPTSYWVDQEFDDAVKRSQTAIVEADRLAAFKEATQRMCDQSAAAFLFALPTTYAVSPRVDWSARPDDWVRPTDMKSKS